MNNRLLSTGLVLVLALGLPATAAYAGGTEGKLPLQLAQAGDEGGSEESAGEEAGYGEETGYGEEAGEGSAAGTAAEESAPAAPAATDAAGMEAEMAAWMKYADPGEPHEFLKKLAGKWTTRAKFWMKPGDEPVESPGTVTAEMILGGRFVQDQYESDWMGKPFRGMGITGYNNYAKVYENVWMDTMGTLMIFGKGSLEDDKTLTMLGSYPDPLSGKRKRFKSVTKLVSDTEHVFEMWDTTGEEPFKTMEIAYTRAQ